MSNIFKYDDENEEIINVDTAFDTMQNLKKFLKADDLTLEEHDTQAPFLFMGHIIYMGESHD